MFVLEIHEKRALVRTAEILSFVENKFLVD